MATAHSLHVIPWELTGTQGLAAAHPKLKEVQLSEVKLFFFLPLDQEKKQTRKINMEDKGLVEKRVWLVREWKMMLNRNNWLPIFHVYKCENGNMCI